MPDPMAYDGFRRYLPGWGHGVDHCRSGEDQDVVLARRNLHPVAVTDPEPQLGDLGNLGSVPSRSIVYS